MVDRSIFRDLPLNNVQLVDFSAAGGGASNQNYFVKTSKDKMFLRVGTDIQAIAKEAKVAVLVSEAGFAPEIVSYSLEDKIIATRMVENLRHFSLHDEDKIVAIAQLVKTMHYSEIQFDATMSPMDTVASLLDEAQALSIEFSDDFLLQLNTLMQLDFDPSLAKPCHLDLHQGNLLYDGQRFWVIDWEYAANSDPLFDLAVMSATENYSDAEMLDLITAYGTPEDYAKLYALRALADARWYIWCVVRGQTSSIDFPYEQEAARYLKAFQDRIAFKN